MSIFQSLMKTVANHFNQIMVLDSNSLDKLINILNEFAVIRYGNSISNFSWLKVHYPKIWTEIEIFHRARQADLYQVIYDGQKQGLVRKELNKQIVTVLFLQIENTIFKPEFILVNHTEFDVLKEIFIDIFLKGIVTQKGLHHLERRTLP